MFGCTDQIWFIFVFSTCAALAAFRIEPCHQGEEDLSNIHLFGPADVECTIDTLLPALFKELINRSIGCGPFVLSCCLLAFQWLIDEKGEYSLIISWSICAQLCLYNLFVCLFNFETLSVSVSNCIHMSTCRSFCLMVCLSVCLKTSTTIT